MATVKCPSCNRQLEVEDAYRDWTVRCPHCEHEFVPNDVWEPRPQYDDRPRRRRRAADDRANRDSDRDRYDDRDRNDDRYDDPDGVPDDVREEALRLVAGPGLCLEICGWLTVLGTIGLAALLLVIAAEMANNPQANQNGDPPELFMMFGCCFGVFGIPYGIAMAIGGRRMRNLSSRGWALTGGVLGVATFTLFGVLGIAHTAVGVWALVTLEKPEVREAFGLPQRPGNRRRRRDWD